MTPLGTAGAIVGAALALGFVRTPAQAPTVPTARPRLLVLIVVDQFRADYVERYGSQWTKGLRELVSLGAVYPNARVPYAATRTCTGYSTIGTGVFPASHGMVDNEWYDRAKGRFVSCTEDPAVDGVSFGAGRAIEHHSAAQMRAPSLAQALRRQGGGPPTIAGVALKARAAIGLTGQGGPNTLAVWEEDLGVWATSTAYASAARPDLRDYVTAHPTTASRGFVWNRLLPAPSYRDDDRVPWEPRSGAFPHVIAGPSRAGFTAAWDSSPLSDAYVGALAAVLVNRLALGGHAGTDLLAVGFSALDYVGHTFGPDSHEVQDVLVRLDATIGTLIGELDRAVGRDRYTIALTSDHGVAAVPERPARPDRQGGRVSPAAVGRVVESALGLAFGPGPYIEAMTASAIYFRPGVLDKIRAEPAVRVMVDRAVLSVPGIARTFWSDEMAAPATDRTEDDVALAVRRSYVADRGGDLIFLPAPFWIAAASGTTHGTPYDYDTRVPLMFFGMGVRTGRQDSAATIVDVAPTLAALAGVALPRTDGRILREILTR